MKILVTGGAGLVGRAICGGLAARGHAVRCVDRSLRPQPGVDGRVADLRVREAIYPHLESVDAVVHLANHANQYRTDAQTVLAENAALNAHVFQAAVECGVRHLIFSSSVQVVSGLPLDPGAEEGNHPPVQALTGHDDPRPGNAYAASKVMGEELLRYHSRVHGLACTTLRLPFILRGRRGLERQATNMSGDTWPHEGFAWLWVGDLAALVAAVLATSRPGYRCLLPSAPPMDAIAAVAAARAAHPGAGVTADAWAGLDGWRPTPLEDLPPDA